MEKNPPDEVTAQAEQIAGAIHSRLSNGNSTSPEAANKELPVAVEARGIQDPSSWHPEYWQVAVLLAAGVFGVWVIRTFVQLFLSNVHLLTDANERVTMAMTNLALLRRDAGLKPEDRQLILQTLFRPAATGVVKDDGIPLSVLEVLTRSGSDNPFYLLRAILAFRSQFDSFSEGAFRGTQVLLSEHEMEPQ